MEQQLVRDWMSKEPVTIAPDLGVGVAYQMMRLHKVRRLAVVEDDDRLLGIVALSDVREAKPDPSGGVWEAAMRLATVEVRDIMAPSPLTVAPDDPMVDAARIMLNEKVGGLPVVEDGRLAGMITETDVLRLLVKEFERGKPS